MVIWLNGWKPLTLGYHAANVGSFSHCGSWDIIFFISHVISRDDVFRELCDFIQGKPLVVTQLPAKFSGHRPCGGGDLTYLIFHTALKNPVIKRFCNLMEESYSLYLTTLSGLVAIGTVVEEISFYFITWPHVIGLVAIGLMVVEI